MTKASHLPQCLYPAETFDLLRQGDKKTWTQVQYKHRRSLRFDIKQSLLKGLRTHKVPAHQINVDSYIHEIHEATWAKFKRIVTNPESQFNFKGHQEAYNYLRMISFTITQKALKKIVEDTNSKLDLVWIDGIDDGKLENFLYRNGGYYEEDIEQQLILEHRIDKLINAIDKLKKLYPIHVEMLMLSVVEEESTKSIAERYGYTPESVDTLLSKIKRIFRGYLSE